MTKPALTTQQKRPGSEKSESRTKKFKFQLVSEEWGEGEGDMWGEPLSVWDTRPTTSGDIPTGALPQRETGRLRGARGNSPRLGFLKMPAQIQIAKIAEVQICGDLPTKDPHTLPSCLEWRFRTQYYLTWVQTKPVILHQAKIHLKSPSQVAPSLDNFEQVNKPASCGVNSLTLQPMGALYKEKPAGVRVNSLTLQPMGASEQDAVYGGTPSPTCECITTYYTEGPMKRTTLCTKTRQLLGYEGSLVKLPEIRGGLKRMKMEKCVKFTPYLINIKKEPYSGGGQLYPLFTRVTNAHKTRAPPIKTSHVDRNLNLQHEPDCDMTPECDQNVTSMTPDDEPDRDCGRNVTPECDLEKPEPDCVRMGRKLSLIHI